MPSVPSRKPSKNVYLEKSVR